MLRIAAAAGIKIERLGGRGVLKDSQTKTIRVDLNKYLLKIMQARDWAGNTRTTRA